MIWLICFYRGVWTEIILFSPTIYITRIMAYAGQTIWDDITILGHLLCPNVCTSVCGGGIWDDIKNLTVPHAKKSCSFLLQYECIALIARLFRIPPQSHGPLPQGDWRGCHPGVHLHRQRPLHRARRAARLPGQAGLRGATHAQPGMTPSVVWPHNMNKIPG